MIMSTVYIEVSNGRYCTFLKRLLHVVKAIVFSIEVVMKMLFTYRCVHLLIYPCDIHK